MEFQENNIDTSWPLVSKYRCIKGIQMNSTNRHSWKKEKRRKKPLNCHMICLHLHLFEKPPDQLLLVSTFTIYSVRWVGKYLYQFDKWCGFYGFPSGLFRVSYICVGFWLMSHLTRDLSQAEIKTTVVTKEWPGKTFFLKIFIYYSNIKYKK